MKAIVMVLVVAVMSVCPVWAQRTQTYDERPRITVNGEAVVNVTPDKIVVNLGIVTRDPDIIAAKQKHNDILRKAMAVLRELKIPEGEIQTDYLSIRPHNDNDYDGQDAGSYVVKNAFVVTLTDLSKIEELTTKVLQAGVNRIHGIEFQTTEFRKYRDQARDLALKGAKEKAGKMAHAMGQTCGAPIQINENWSGSYGRSQISLNAMVSVQNGSGEVPDTIALGKIAMRANVTVTFELKNQASNN